MKAILKRILADCKHYKNILFILMLYLCGTQLIFHASCPSVILLGLPCPGCGLTRAGICLLRGNLAGAVSINPTIFLWITLLLYFFICRYIRNQQPKHSLLFATLIGIAAIIWFLYSAFRGNTIPVGCLGLMKQMLLFLE